MLNDLNILVISVDFCIFFNLWSWRRELSEEAVIVERFLGEEGLDESIKEKILKIIKGMGKLLSTMYCSFSISSTPTRVFNAYFD